MTNRIFYIKKGDRLPTIRSTLYQPDGEIQPLTSVSGVKFIMYQNGTEKINAAASVLEGGTTGAVEYAWATNDTNTSGVYKAEWQVTFTDGKPQTFPNKGYISVIITDDLAN